METAAVMYTHTCDMFSLQQFKLALESNLTSLRTMLKARKAAWSRSKAIASQTQREKGTL